jgi:hypothetical protein
MLSPGSSVRGPSATVNGEQRCFSLKRPRRLHGRFELHPRRGNFEDAFDKTVCVKPIEKHQRQLGPFDFCSSEKRFHFTVGMKLSKKRSGRRLEASISQVRWQMCSPRATTVLSLPGRMCIEVWPLGQNQREKCGVVKVLVTFYQAASGKSSR